MPTIRHVRPSTHREDPWEETNLVQNELGEAPQAALRKFQAVVDSLPDRDARPLYVPRAHNLWDQKFAADKWGN